MARYNSLLTYLDKTLPSSAFIAFKNFFSFLPFVNRVDDEIKVLRNLVNSAKKDKDNTDYLQFYSTNKNFFEAKYAPNIMSFEYSRHELPPTYTVPFNSNTISYTAPLEAPTHGELPPSYSVSASLSTLGGVAPRITPTELATAVVEEAELEEPKPWDEALLNRIINQQDSHDQEYTDIQQERIAELVDSLNHDSEQEDSLVKDFVHLIGNQHDHRTATCVVYLIDEIYRHNNKDSSNLITYYDELKRNYFNNLENRQDVDSFQEFIKAKEEIAYHNLRHIVFNEFPSAPLATEYKQDIKTSVIRLTHTELSTTPEQRVNSLVQRVSKMNGQQLPILERILNCLKQVKFIFSLRETDPALVSRARENYIAEDLERKRESGRAALKEKIREGLLSAIDEDELHDLYPDPEAFASIARQCYAVGAVINQSASTARACAF